MAVSSLGDNFSLNLTHFGPSDGTVPLNFHDSSFNPVFFAFQPQKGKQGTKGSKQIVEENAQTLKFYQYMAAGSTTIYFLAIFVFFEFTTWVSVRILLLPSKCHRITSSGFSGVGIHLCSDFAGRISIHGLHVSGQII